MPAKFGQFDGPISDRHDVFLHHQLCQTIPSPYWHHVLGYSFTDPKWLKIPSNEFINWLDELGIDHMVHSSWADGCSLYIIHPTENVMAMIKLRWDSKVCRV